MKFAEIIGQDKVKNYLISTVKSSRVSHAQLIIGPEGTGKLPLAIAYARFINCTNKQYYEGSGLAGDSCGNCPSCVKFASLAHPDLHFFYPVTTTKQVSSKPRSSDFISSWRELFAKTEGYFGLHDWYDHIGVENKQGIINAEDCDEIVRKLGYKAYEAEYKTVIIWMAEKLYHSAAPKILKILEEPPEKTLFLLVSDYPDQLLSTIVSRTQMVKVTRLPEIDITRALMTRHQLTEPRARRIAILSGGNYRAAVDLIQDAEEDDEHFLLLRDWFRLCYRANQDDMVELTKFSDELARIGREKQKSFLAYALRVVRHCLLINFGNNDLVRLEGNESEFVSKLARFVTPSNGPEIASAFEQSVFHVERNANARVLFLDLSLQLCRLLSNRQV